MKRLFVGIELPKEVRKQIAQELIVPLGALNKTEEEKLHITLCFLGDVRDGAENEVANLLEKISFKRFNVLVGRPGNFDERVLWVSAEAIELYSLAEQISKVLHVDCEFNGHITIARSKNESDFEKEFSKIKNKRINKSISVKKFVLFESKLTKEGSFYTKLKEFKGK